ncbi:ABC transporter ATP-binding protein [Aquicoccus sp. G2-2]|uniref:ABC transporter ATP-binding protein n=1 Tax=Aquicoccus sp. G2-2 TaxID=3092120 RepID=UPI002ADF2B8E|nr:ABC transporter ATP-binding protein [Aquicoccus sp. G2-2]MEA1114974.1 ABC transporter ATP-binding protein [Aquicoccus sp. G2-2]
MTPLLEIGAARRIFTTPEGRNFAALDGIDLTVGDGEFVTLLGPSGCGKTTLLRAIAGFEQIDKGTIRLDGADLTGLPPHKRAVNTVFQSYALFPHMSVARNVGYALEVQGVSRTARETAVTEALDKVGMADLGSRKPDQLSGGQQQRVALARAIVAEPRLLLLDEPLSALDRNLRQQMQFELKELQHRLGIAFVFVTHDQEEALTMSDRIVVMRAGKVEQIGTPREIYRQPKTRFVAEFIGETNLFPVPVARINGPNAEIDLAGQTLTMTADNLQVGAPVTAAIRPTDFILGSTGIAGTVTRAVYLGADLHLKVAPETGHEISVIARDTAHAPNEGDKVHLSFDPACAHLMEGTE